MYITVVLFWKAKYKMRVFVIQLSKAACQASLLRLQFWTHFSQRAEQTGLAS